MVCRSGHLIALASLLLDRLFRLTDPEAKAKHKRLLKAVATVGVLSPFTALLIVKELHDGLASCGRSCTMSLNLLKLTIEL